MIQLAWLEWVRYSLINIVYQNSIEYCEYCYIGMGMVIQYGWINSGSRV